MTVTEWTNVQNQLTDEGDQLLLWHLIEQRTFGKRWRDDVAIAIMPSLKPVVEAALLVAERDES